MDADEREEIVCEVGGGDHGGGLVVLELTGGALERTVNTGVFTYNDDPFVGMWGVRNGSARSDLVVYTSDPEEPEDIGTELGFLTLTMQEGRLDVRRFVPVNKMLDDVNSRREVLHYPEEEAFRGYGGADDSAGERSPFLFLDYVTGEGYLMKRPVYSP
jgi:hypothetical protein